MLFARIYQGRPIGTQFIKSRKKLHKHMNEVIVIVIVIKCKKSTFEGGEGHKVVHGY